MPRFTFFQDEIYSNDKETNEKLVSFFLICASFFLKPEHTNISLEELTIA
jgi:hypothetical protein